ncbi:MAG: transketolase family protein [Armatimonadetes bacterium]|nr:transketolase family protein [Armatimonadota bacterium]
MADRMSTRDAYGKALLKLGETNPRVVVLDADLWTSTRTQKFREKWPERFVDLGIAEQNMIGVAAGLALEGKIPFASSFACFGARGWEQVRVSVGIAHVNVKLAFTHGGLTVGEDGASAQMLEDLALWRVLPGMVVIVPADGVEAEKATLAAAEHVGPVYLRFGRSSEPIIFPADYDFRIGKAAKLRDGANVTIAACGIMTARAMEAAERLSAEGIEATLLNVATIKPIDRDAIVEAAKATGAFVTAEEHQVNAGLGGAVAEVLGLNHPVPLEMVAVQDSYGESGTPDELLEKYGLTVDAIIEAAQKAIARREKRDTILIS